MKQINFDMPVTYSISIQGLITYKLKEILGDTKFLEIKEEDEDNTEIQIQVKDQAHLMGILKYLFEARYVILNINYLPHKHD